MDWISYKKILLDEFREDYPDRTKEEEAAFYTAMTWLENELDLGAVKARVLETLDKTNPNLDEGVRKAFIHGLERFALVIADETSIKERLNDFLPESVHNEYLRKTLEGVRELVAQNEKLRSERDKAVNIMETFKTMSNADKSKLRRENAYKEMGKEIESLKAELKRTQEFRDRLLCRELMKEK